MITENTDLIITGAAGVLSTIGGWFVGRRKKQVETDKAAYEAYNFALQSLRNEFEQRINDLHNHIDLLQKHIEEMRQHVCFDKKCPERKRFV